MAETSIILNVLYNFKKLKNMKLRNLLYATMIACAFASCSNDDDPIDNAGGGDGPQLGENEAALVVNMAGVQTKAIPGADKENTINSSKVVVFNGTTADALVEAVGEVNQSGAETKKVTVTPGNKRVLVLANYEGTITEGETTLSELKKVTLSFDNAEDGYLTMNSALYTVSLEGGQVNYLGYVENSVKNKGHYLGNANGSPVYLYHNVAKVVLNSIKVSNSTVESQYPNPQLDIKEVFILHAYEKSKLFTDAAWGTTVVGSSSYLNGNSTGNTYASWVEKLASYTPVFSHLSEGELNSAYYVASLSGCIGFKSKLAGAGNPTDKEKEIGKAFYTYENTTVAGDAPIYTLLVVKGDFSYDGYAVDGKALERKKESDRYYTAAVGITGFKDGYTLPTPGVAGLSSEVRAGNLENGKYAGVIRNLQYNVNMTVKGPGYTTPFGPKGDQDTFLTVNAEVVAFGAVKQDVDFE